MINPKNEVLSGEAWFEKRGWNAFPFQREAWSAYANGASGLVSAPTGMGKTLSVWIGPLLEWANTHRDWDHKKPAPLQVLWITPLRALANDTLTSLELPIRELELPWTVELRTGDTTAALRRRQQKQFPSALITTPESLSLLLSYPETREKFQTLRCVVVDEWHELLGSKRGVQTELALAHLRRWIPDLRTWGLSATLQNPQYAMDVLVGTAPRQMSPQLVCGEITKDVEIVTLEPTNLDRFPWAGHLGLQAIPQVVEALSQAQSTLLFTNTRNQAENWFQALTLYEPDWEPQLALHHGSIDRSERERVEAKLATGDLRCVVCTSSLDLGVDFPVVDQVIQVGSPKGIARLLQRAGRSGHQPGGVSRILCVPTNAFELVEFAAARTAAQERHLEPRLGIERSLDVLAQHLITIGLGDGFVASEMLAEVRTTHAFAHLTDAEWQWTCDFVTNGGALHAYPQYQKLVERDGRYSVESREIARFHRLSIGTITSDSMVSVQFAGGAKLGYVDESFIARLKPRDKFIFAGRLLELVIFNDMKAYVRKATGTQGTVPKWGGARMPISSELSEAVRRKLSDAGNGVFDDPEMRALKPILAIQTAWSHLPRETELLIERTKTREGHHLFLYPFAGRFVNEGLAALFAYRLSQAAPLSINVSATDYGLELLSREPIAFSNWSTLFTADNLLDDLMACLNAAELAKRQFRDIARIAGLIFSGYPGAKKQARQYQASSGLLYDVFLQYDPQNLLLDLARREVLQNQLDLSRLSETLQWMSGQRIIEVTTKRLTPLAFPIWAERIQAQVSSEKWSDRVKTMALQLEKAAAW